MEKAAFCKTGLPNKEMPPLKNMANSSVQLETMEKALGQWTMTGIYQNHKSMAPQKLPVPQSLDYITAPWKGTPTPYEEGQHTVRGICLVQVIQIIRSSILML